jgi:DNA polymerase-4/protein ImuB
MFYIIVSTVLAGAIMRVLCVLILHFPLICEIRRHPSIKGRPAIVTYASGFQKLVMDYSPELEGLQRNMPLQQAFARHGEVELLQADILYYRTVFNRVLDELEEISPLVEGTDLDQAYIGLDGLHLLYPNDEAVINAVREAIPEDFAPQMGIAENKFLAYLAALYSSPDSYQILSGDAGAFLRDFPCDVLPVSLKSKNRLHDFGMHTLGQVATLPPGPFQAQFGLEGRKIIDLARGHDDTPLYPRFIEELIEESVMLPSVTVSLEAILLAVESLLVRIFAKVSAKGLGIRKLALWTRSWNSEQWERAIQFKELAMDMRTTIPRIKRVLEYFPQPGPAEQVGVKITRFGYLRGRQKSLFSEIRAKDHLAEDIQQLELRLGSPQVYKVKEVEPWSRIPERRYALAPADR